MIDNIQILKAIDERQQQMNGRPLPISAHHLLGEITGRYAPDPQLAPGFLQELFIARAAGHLDWHPVGQAANPQNADYYLQQVQDLALTSQGQDRARGRMVELPAPAPGEDDGHELSDLVLQQVAEIITGEYAADQRVTFLAEEGVPPDSLQLPERFAPDDVHAVLAATWRSGSLGRRLVRLFLGRWLDERLITGPDAEQRASLIGQLMRQGWQIRESDSVLVAAEPTRGIPVAAPPLHTWRPHALIEAKARPQFLIRQPSQAVFASMKAVEIRVRQLADLHEDSVGVSLMNLAFGDTGPLTDLSAPKGEQQGMRFLFAGAMAVPRNQTGHRESSFDEEAEATEGVALSSLLMRMLDQVEARLVTAGRAVQVPPPPPGAP